MLLLLAVLLATCQAADLITLTSAEQSSNYYTDKNFAADAIDGDLASWAITGIFTLPTT